jgi:hypothetical protein
MIALIAASAMYLAAGQATIVAPTASLKDCLKTTSGQAVKDKVKGDAYEGYARNACTGQIGGLRNALIAFEVKNGTKRADAAKDADLTVDDYVASSVDKYQFMAGVAEDNAKAEAAAVAPKPVAPPVATPAPTPAAAPQQPK